MSIKSATGFLAPSVLSADFAALGPAISALADQPSCGWLHLDVMDGHYVPNLTIGPPVLKALTKLSPLPAEAHLMIDNPAESWAQYHQAGVERIIVHPETVTHLHRLAQAVTNAGCQFGLALNPAQPLELLALPYIGEFVSVVTLMTVNPGFPAQQLIMSTTKKIAALAAELSSLGLSEQVTIELDGGINADNLPTLKAAGGQLFVAGNAIYGDGLAAVPAKLKALSEAYESKA